jgi:hypothetical protein
LGEDASEPRQAAEEDARAARRCAVACSCPEEVHETRQEVEEACGLWRWGSRGSRGGRRDKRVCHVDLVVGLADG